jgi:uncharacterized 2Fe-2S/4Fe-4S cluster protein (DUF4445 family)
MTLYHIDFEPIGRRGDCSNEQSLLESARQLSVDLVSICGGMGSCGRCKVQIASGQVSGITVDEQNTLTPREIEQGYRLACQIYPLSDVKLHVPPESLTAPQRTQVEGLEVAVLLDPPVRAFDVQLVPPTLASPIADDVALWQALAEQHHIQPGIVDFRVAQTVSTQLRNLNWSVRVGLRGHEIVAIGSTSQRLLGFAVDIGTTKIAGYLLDLESGQTLASQGMMNPQISYGEDVVTRMGIARRSLADAELMHRLLADALNQMVDSLCAQINDKPENIVEAVIVGNTAIHHLFLRLPVAQLGLAPYVPATRAALDIKARDLGLHIAQGAYVHLLPNIAGYAGADHVAMILATQIADADGVVLALDIGTNTEICLNNRGKLSSVSCASGPAFEGAHIKFGMRAAPGAIEHMRMTRDKIEYQTIGGGDPVGICGSGLLDIVAQLRLNGVLNRHGQVLDHPNVRETNGVREFVLVSEIQRPGQTAIVVSQLDVRELQLAKGAIRSGIQVLVESEGLTEQDIDRVIIAGAFGTFIDVASAVTIGMLPSLPLDHFTQVGNAAGTGARLALISLEQRAHAKTIAERDGYIELASVPGFQRKFAQATFLG